MTATLTINFDDGTTKDIVLEKAIEINLPPTAKQSLCFNQTISGGWVMTFSKPIFENKKLKNLTVAKNQV